MKLVMLGGGSEAGRDLRARLCVVRLHALLTVAFVGLPLSSRAEQEPNSPPADAIAAQQACTVALPDHHGSAMAMTSQGAAVACFSGPITRESAKLFLSLPIPDSTPVVLDSGGGDVDSALDMANLIMDQQLPVVVSRWCMSSCANYLFLAGKTKVVLPESYVGWHGGPSKRPSPTLTEQGRQVYRGTMAKQAAFFKRVGVNADLIYEPRPGSGVTQDNRETKVWTWGPIDLRERFGVVGIRWMWFPGGDGKDNTDPFG